MLNDHSISIPNKLHSFHDAIESSLKPCAIIAQTENNPTLFSSKFSGHPYMPSASAHPKDEDGYDMLLLAQINFAEVQLAAPFPQVGLLQFFISPYLYEHLQKNKQAAEEKALFYIRYYPYLLSEQEIVQDFSYLQESCSPTFPLKCEKAIRFTPQPEPVSATDYRLHTLLNATLLEQVTEDGRTYEEIYLEHYLGAAHKIGGYPYFLEDDFRADSLANEHYDTLLLQIISDDEDDILWGNSGVLKFFINGSHLEQLDFSNVLLHAEDY